MRTYVWGRLRDWLRFGAIDKYPQLELDPTGPATNTIKKDRVVLESKEHMQARATSIHRMIGTRWR